MVIFRRGGSENCNFPPWWFCNKQNFSVEVLPKNVIFRQGGSVEIPIGICSLRFQDSKIWIKIQDHDLSLNLKN